METCVKLKKVDMALQKSVLAIHEMNGYSGGALGLHHGANGYLFI
jgi:hypothetical protein